MGHRLSKIVTRTGDDGSTGLADGSRVAKDDPRIIAIGAIDELNSAIGVVLCHPLAENLQQGLIQIQHHLFDLGGELSIPGSKLVGEDSVAFLEDLLAELNHPLPPLKEFILPGGTPAAAFCHQARALCRRAESELVRLKRGQTVSAISLRYVNRLSDLLFIAARHMNFSAGVGDVLWRGGPTSEQEK